MYRECHAELAMVRLILGEGYFDENSFLPSGKKGSATQAQNRDRFCGLPKS